MEDEKGLPPFFMSEELRNANWKDRFLWLIGRRPAFIVTGDSMTPVLVDGAAVLIQTRAKLAVGDIVLAEHPYKSSVKILKRITEIDSDGRHTLTGDNAAESTDSRTFGAVSIESIIGKVVCRLK